MASPAPPHGSTRWPVVLPSATGHYLLAFDGSRVVAGATRQTGSGFDVRVTPRGLAEVLANALAVAPGLSTGTLLETGVGLRPAGPDIRPLLGPVAGWTWPRSTRSANATRQALMQHDEQQPAAWHVSNTWTLTI